MAYKKEYSWSDVKKLVADSEARPSPFSYTLAGFSYQDEWAVYDAAMIGYAPLKAAFDVQKQAAVDQRKADVEAYRQANPGKKPTGFGPLVLPAAPAAPAAPQQPAAADFHGHASSMHHSFTDQQLVQRGAQMGVASAFTSKAVVDGGISVKTLDQSFLIRSILNSKLGQAALGALDAAPTPARLMITQAEPLEVNMRVAKTGMAGTATPGIKQIRLIVDSGAASLHIVTCYPQDSADGGDRYMSDSGYSITKIEHRASTPGVSVRWSTQTNKPIV
jgi:hypothetical protein